MNFAIAFAFGNVGCVSNFYSSKSSTFHFCAEHGAGLKTGAKTRCLTLEKGHSTHSSRTLLSKSKAMVQDTYVSPWLIVQKPHWLFTGSIIKLGVLIEMPIKYTVIFNKNELKLFSADA